MGGKAAFMAYSIPICLQRYLSGTRFSDTLWDFYGSCVRHRSGNADLLLLTGMTAGVKACTALLEFYWFVTPTQTDAIEK